MKKLVLDGVDVSYDFDAEEVELKKYLAIIAKKTKRNIKDIVTAKFHLMKDGNVDIDYSIRGQKFDRIRRITGYLVGTVDRWNDAKQAELRDRVKHSLA